jgi:REP element-mobilizing transposase RayT
MARLPRFVIPDQPQHVIVRGNNRAEILCADADYVVLSSISNDFDTVSYLYSDCL